jgi:tripeptidyl-peptidase-1
LYEVSTPGQAQYGQHLSQLEVKRIIAPSDHGRVTVLDWLNRSNVNITHDTGERIHFEATVGNADLMFGTNFRKYKHTTDPAEIKIRTRKVMLPSDVFDNVEMIHPTTYFGSLQSMHSVIRTSEFVDTNEADPNPDCSVEITPTCLEELYGIKGVEITDASKVGFIGVPGFLEQIARFSDLARFLEGTPSKAKSEANFTYSVVNG